MTSHPIKIAVIRISLNEILIFAGIFKNIQLFVRIFAGFGDILKDFVWRNDPVGIDVDFLTIFIVVHDV